MENKRFEERKFSSNKNIQQFQQSFKLRLFWNLIDESFLLQIRSWSWIVYTLQINVNSGSNDQFISETISIRIHHHYHYHGNE